MNDMSKLATPYQDNVPIKYCVISNALCSMSSTKNPSQSPLDNSSPTNTNKNEIKIPEERHNLSLTKEGHSTGSEQSKTLTTG